MKYNISAKTTTYNGVNFRSILEARWAAFFDLVGWEWKYEPFEINGKVPDFVLYVNNKTQYATNQIIVEIKPSIFIDDKFKRELLSKYNNIKAHILLLDENPFFINEYSDLISIGYLSQYLEQEHNEFYDAELKPYFDIGSNYMLFDGIFGNCPIDLRKCFIDVNDKKEHKLLIHLWNVAQNIVQFKSY